MREGREVRVGGEGGGEGGEGGRCGREGGEGGREVREGGCGGVEGFRFHFLILQPHFLELLSKRRMRQVLTTQMLLNSKYLDKLVLQVNLAEHFFLPAMFQVS